MSLALGRREGSDQADSNPNYRRAAYLCLSVCVFVLAILMATLYGHAMPAEPVIQDVLRHAQMAFEQAPLSDANGQSVLSTDRGPIQWLQQFAFWIAAIFMLLSPAFVAISSKNRFAWLIVGWSFINLLTAGSMMGAFVLLCVCGYHPRFFPSGNRQ